MINTNLKQLFDTSGLTINELCSALGIKYSTVYSYLRGNTNSGKYFDSIYEYLEQYNKKQSATTVRNERKNMNESTRLTAQISIPQKVYEEVKANNEQKEFVPYQKFQRNYEPLRGEIYYIDNKFAEGSEMRGAHPAIIISDNRQNATSTLVSYVYLTSTKHATKCTHVSINSSKKPSIALCEAVFSCDKSRLTGFMCKVSQSELQSVMAAVSMSLGLKDKNATDHVEMELLKRELEVYKKIYSDILVHRAIAAN